MNKCTESGSICLRKPNFNYEFQSLLVRNITLGEIYKCRNIELNNPKDKILFALCCGFSHYNHKALQNVEI